MSAFHILIFRQEYSDYFLILKSSQVQSLSLTLCIKTLFSLINWSFICWFGLCVYVRNLISQLSNLVENFWQKFTCFLMMNRIYRVVRNHAAEESDGGEAAELRPATSIGEKIREG